MAHHHRWWLVYNLPLGIPDAAGWVQKVLVRACRECQYIDILPGLKAEDSSLWQEKVHVLGP